jgi:hypothetical protein
MDTPLEGIFFCFCQAFVALLTLGHLKTKLSGLGMSSMIEPLLSVWKALGLTPRIAENKITTKP